MEQNAKQYQFYYDILLKIFGNLDESQIKKVFNNTQIHELEVGEYLFKQGDTENSLYIVLSGRLRVILQNDNGNQILGDISTGEPVGELALFTKEPRIASVVAIRKSVVFQLTEADYLRLVNQYPTFAHTLSNYVINRLRRNAFQQRMGAPPKNIAVVKLQQDMDISPWTNEIRHQLGLMKVNINVYFAEDHLNEQSNALFDEMENHDGLNFLVCDNNHPVWANQCLTYSDLVLVVSDFYAPSEIYSIENRLKLYESNILNKKIYLVLLHPENGLMPTMTSRWFINRNINLHLHIRKNNGKDLRRFSRIITHQAIGLVLGGGGSKGFSHIGAAKAMLESGIEFDFLGGTSAGALYGIMMCFKDFDIQKATDICKLGVVKKITSNDYNLPIISLMTGRKIRLFLKETLGDIFLEDLWVNTFCVSTNYSTATIKIHESGLARLQVEASIAIPGVYPPVIIDRHLHVDGGVMDNLPIDAMYQKPVKHIIALSLSAQSPHLVDIETVPTAWELFINKFTKKHRYRLPRMASILINSLTLNSVQKQEITKTQVSMYLEMDLRNYGFLDGDKWSEILEKGYQQTKSYLNQMPQNERFWK